MLEEIGWTVHETTQAYAALDAVEVAAARGLELREQIDCAQTRRSLSVLDADITADFTDVLHLARLAGNLARHIGDIADYDEWDVVSGRGTGRRQCDSQFVQTLLDLRRHPEDPRAMRATV